MLKERQLQELIMQLKYFRSKGLTNMDHIEKFIETQKLKSKNAYDKNYNSYTKNSGASASVLQNAQNNLI